MLYPCTESLISYMFQQYIVISIQDMVPLLAFCYKGKIGEFGTSLGALQIPMKGNQNIYENRGPTKAIILVYIRAFTIYIVTSVTNFYEYSDINFLISSRLLRY